MLKELIDIDDEKLDKLIILLETLKEKDTKYEINEVYKKLNVFYDEYHNRGGNDMSLEEKGRVMDEYFYACIVLSLDVLESVI